MEVVHRSFQLDPSRPKGHTQKRREMLMAKYGLSVEQVETLDARMEQTAAAEGLEYHLGEDGVTGNTFDAHRLLQLAGARGRAGRRGRAASSAPTSPRAGRSSSPTRCTGLAVEAGLDESRGP